MIKVIYPTGLSITYNNAHFLSRSPDGWRLFPSEKDSENGINIICVVQASAGAAFEFVSPCKVEKIMKELTDLDLLDELERRLYNISGFGSGGKLAQIKRQLKKYSIRYKQWRL